MKFILRAFLSILILTSLQSPILAAGVTTLNICNQSSEVFYFAVAHKQGAQIVEDEWKVQGIYEVTENNCLVLFQTDEAINAYLALVKVKDGQIVPYKGKYSATSDIAKDANKAVCISVKSFKYFTADADMRECGDGYFSTMSYINLDIAKNPKDTPVDHRVFIN